MSISRRKLLNYSLGVGATSLLPTDALRAQLPDVPYKRIATEEAWTTPEIVDQYRRLLRENSGSEPGFQKMWARYVDPATTSPLLDRLLDLGENRLNDMDRSGIDMQVLMLTAPGVQVFEPDLAVNLAADSNDQLAEAIVRHPDRYAGLGHVAPQSPAAAAKEIERCMTTLGLSGVINNSHTKGEYLADQKFWEIFEAAEALDAPLYIHPRTPAPRLLPMFMERGMERAIMGFGVEVALHTLDIIVSGVFDRFPKLKLVIGHGGEGLPYWMYRIDHMHENLPDPSWPKLEMKPSDYMRRNLYITSSGVPWGPAITMAQSVMGVDHVLYAMDYPYQFLAEEVTLSDEMDMSAEDKMKFFQTNAEDLFHIKAT